MRRRAAPLFPLPLACALLAIAACGAPESGPPRAAAPSEPTHQEFGDLQIHYNALRTDELAPEVARAYGIERSANRVMLNVSLLRKDAEGRTTPVDGTVTASYVPGFMDFPRFDGHTSSVSVDRKSVV